jgi:orotidine-5'-phosphate decarboxylase
LSQARHFADDLILRLRELGHPLCVGLDPYLEQIPPLFRRGEMSPADPRSAAAMQSFLYAVVDRLEGRVAAVKPQIAFFERLGWRGIQVLERVVARVQRLGIAVVLDAKRGDIGSTAQGYADAYLRDDSPLEASAITVSPYLGRETLAPFVERARENGRGLFVLVKTSNPGSGDLQDLMVDGTPVYQQLARSLAELAARLEGPATGWSSLGAVVGATHPDQAEKVREALPRSLFLIPGYGAQGASAAEAVRGLVVGPKGLEGGLVASSRAILFPADWGTSDATVWEKAVDAALERATNELGEAVAG